ncbi:MAG TPA: hypothetical protein VFR60_07610 [Sphingomicrobium sp.]|nr:hypothetical protein [Sphingomicrobium sp.]
MREAAPLPVMIVAGLIIIAAMATFGALWSGSEAGTAFAEAATSSYDSGWLPWAGVLVGLGCGVGMFLGWPMSRWLFCAWMGFGVVEGLFLLEEQHFNPLVLGAYVLIGVLLFLPALNEWFRKD